MPIWWGTGAGWFNPIGWFSVYGAWIAYQAAYNPNAYPPGSWGNY